MIIEKNTIVNISNDLPYLSPNTKSFACREIFIWLIVTGLERRKQARPPAEASASALAGR